jgi:cyanophycin synthetase
MQFRKVRALRGPNIWANSPVIEAWVDLGPLKDTASNAVPGFNDRLKSWLPTMIEHECSEGHRGGFFVRLDEGTYPAHILEHVTLELQNLAGTPVGYGRARVTSEEGVYRVVFKYREEAVGRACLDTARELVLAALEDRPFDVAAEVQRLRDLARRELPGVGTGALIAAAKERGIPCRRLDAECLIQLGYGAKQRRISASETDRTGAIATAIASDKELTRQLLDAVGVPVPEGQPVESAEEAWEAAQELGLPVVVKPRASDYGRHVELRLTTREEVVEAYHAAAQEGNGVLVERMVPGDTYRLLVVGGKVVAAVRRDPTHVVGDGRSTVAELIDRSNADPRRGEDFTSPLRKIPLDEFALAALAEQGYSPEHVAPAGHRVALRRKVNHVYGSTDADVTDDVHPEVAARAAEAVRMVGLDVAGLDVIARDIGRPLEEQGGVVLEINPSPGLRMHLEPAEGKPRPVAEAILDSLFPDGQAGRIPIAAITGVNGKTTVTRLIGHIARAFWSVVGMTCTDGIYVGARRIEAGDCSGPKSARAILLNPMVEAAVFECARGGILREGLGFDKCDVAVVTNIGAGDHLGMDEIHTPEDVIKVKRVPVDVVLPTGYAVLNAADPLVARMAEYCRGGVIYFARDASEAVLAAHRAAGGRAAFARDGLLVLAEGAAEHVLIDLADVPLTRGGRVGFQVENTLAAAAAAWGLGIPFDTVRAALATFESAPDRTPGRFNVIEHEGATIVVDFGHNPSALESLAGSLAAFPGARRTVVLSADGDRRDEVIVRQAEILADAFDRVILYEEGVRMRGRADGEIFELLRRGLAAGRRVSETREVQGEEAAIAHAIGELEPGDFLLVLLDAVETSLPFIQSQLARKVHGEPREALTAQR